MLTGFSFEETLDRVLFSGSLDSFDLDLDRVLGLGCSENCIFHDIKYPEFFSLIPLYIIKRRKLKFF